MEDQSQTIGGLQEVPTMATLQQAQSAIDQEFNSSSHLNYDSNSNGINNQRGNEDDSNEMTIARRTRSRVYIGDSVLGDNLDFPDVDRGLYQSADSEGDTEYKKFCRQMFASDDSKVDANTDDNDPTYVYNDDVFCPGWRFDLDEELRQECVPTTSNADNINIDNLDEDQDDRAHRLDLCASFSDPNLAVSSLSMAPGFKSPNKFGRRKIDLFNEPEFKRILDQQLRQHIQLLTQTYLLTKNTTNTQDEAAEAKGYLVAYMKIFKNKAKPSNLLPAIELVNSYSPSRDIQPYVRSNWRHLPMPEAVKTLLDTRRDIFMYANLLPEVAFSLLREKLVAKKAKVIFTPNEDKLLAYALNEFKGETSQYAYIASLLMAAKTKMQINNHIKNIKRPGKTFDKDHPVNQFFSQGKLPHIDLDADAKIRNARAPSELEDDDFDRDKQLQEEVRGEQSQHVAQVFKVEEQKFSDDCVTMIQQHFDQKQHLQQQQHHQHQQQQQNQQDQLFEQLQPPTSPKNPDPSPDLPCEDPLVYHNHDDMMNMDLDDLMAASTTISKTANLNYLNPNGSGGNNGNINSATTSEKNIKNLRLRSSMLELMTNRFSVSETMGNLIVEEFIGASSTKLTERDHLHLLQLLTDLMRKEANKADSVITIYEEISKYLAKVDAPNEFQERLVLFLNLDQAGKCGRAFSYLHWMRFFEFIHHVELHHDGEAIEKKLARLIDALTKDDPHKVKLAVANLINKHPLLKREFDSLELDSKPHSSLFLCEEDFDDITEPMAIFRSRDISEHESDGSVEVDVLANEHFELKPSPEELNFASPSCPCCCHNSHNADDKQQRLSIASSTGSGGDQHNIEQGQHCNKCNLKFMKGRMYLVNKIKPFLAEWSYVNTPPPSEASTSSPATATLPDNQKSHDQSSEQPTNCDQLEPKWTFEEDKEILEFCRAKAELNDENISFDATTFEELVTKRRTSCHGDETIYKKSSREIAERFNQLMEMYRIEGG